MVTAEIQSEVVANHEFDLAVAKAISFNKARPTGQLLDIVTGLFQQSGLSTRIHSQGERQAVVGVAPESRVMAQVVSTEKRYVYTRYNEGPYNINQQPVWNPAITGTKEMEYYASIPRNVLF